MLRILKGWRKRIDRPRTAVHSRVGVSLPRAEPSLVERERKDQREGDWQ
jgi:hypothetical protein